MICQIKPLRIRLACFTISRYFDFTSNRPVRSVLIIETEKIKKQLCPFIASNFGQLSLSVTCMMVDAASYVGSWKALGFRFWKERS